jgi:hypothetical protein
VTARQRLDACFILVEMHAYGIAAGLDRRVPSGRGICVKATARDCRAGRFLRPALFDVSFSGLTNGLVRLVVVATESRR